MAKLSSCGARTARKSAHSAITASKPDNSTTSIRSSPPRRAMFIPAKSTPGCGCRSSLRVLRRRSEEGLASSEWEFSYSLFAIRRPAASFQQRDCLIERQTDDVAVGAVNEAHQGFSAALNGIASRLSEPLAACGISFDIARRQHFERNARGYDPCTNVLGWARECNRCQDLVTTPG